MNDITVWQDVFAEHKAAVAQELGYSVDVSWFAKDPADIPEEARDAVKNFEAALYQRLYEQTCEQIEQLRRVLGAVVERRERRALAWLRVSNYADLEQAARAIVPIADNSTGRQIESFITNYLPVLDEAGVDPADVGDVLAREDKVITVVARAIARTVKAGLSPEETGDKIREIVSDAATLPSAADLGRKYLNGHTTILCDRVTFRDGTQIVVFVCRDGDDAATLAKYTARIEAQWGNTEMALLEWAYKEWKRAAD